MTDRRDADYSDDPLAPHETQSVRRTVDDVDEIMDDRRYWRRAKRQFSGVVAWMLGAPVALAGAWKGGVYIAAQIAKWTGKAP